MNKRQGKREPCLKPSVRRGKGNRKRSKARGEPKEEQGIRLQNLGIEIIETLDGRVDISRMHLPTPPPYTRTRTTPTHKSQDGYEDMERRAHPETSASRDERMHRMHTHSSEWRRVELQVDAHQKTDQLVLNKATCVEYGRTPCTHTGARHAPIPNSV